MTISYSPSKDTLAFKLRPRKRKPSKVVDGFKLWWDKEGVICSVDIAPYTKALEDFMKNLNTVRLGGLWKGVEITGDEIEQARRELTKKLEERW
ncbi:MAG: hypothetical protein HY694_12785 [Deltaproteobacteria bacterium]|nr:hypothetical protein [Deltaproteobacteria bacterium]